MYSETMKDKRSLPQRLPIAFPQIVRLNNDGTMHSAYLHFDKTGNEEFEYYFCDRILSRMRSQQTKFRDRKTKIMLSDIFTPPDEAFALMIIYNEQECWDSEREPSTVEMVTGVDSTSESQDSMGRTGNQNGTIQLRRNSVLQGVVDWMVAN